MNRPRSSTSSSETESSRTTVIDAAVRPAFDFRDAWDRRELLGFLVWRDVVVRYKQTVVGVAWAIARPAFGAAVFAVFFGYLARLPSDGVPPVAFYLAGLVPWTYFASALGQATGSVVENRSLVTRVYFPRVFLPMSAVITPLFDTAIAAGFLLPTLVAVGIAPTVRSLLVIPLLGFIAIAAFGLGSLLAGLNARYRDVRHAVPFGIELLMFLSPVAYPASIVPDRFRLLYALNPLSTAIESFRFALTGRGSVDLAAWVVSASVVAILLVVGLGYFRRVEDTLADVV